MPPLHSKNIHCNLLLAAVLLENLRITFLHFGLLEVTYFYLFCSFVESWTANWLINKQTSQNTPKLMATVSIKKTSSRQDVFEFFLHSKASEVQTGCWSKQHWKFIVECLTKAFQALCVGDVAVTRLRHFFWTFNIEASWNWVEVRFWKIGKYELQYFVLCASGSVVYSVCGVCSRSNTAACLQKPRNLHPLLQQPRSSNTSWMHWLDVPLP